MNFDLGGDDETKFKTSLSSYIALKDVELQDEQKERIIELYTIFGKETNEAEAELEKYSWYANLDKGSKNIIRSKISNVSGWGKLSREFLEKITVKTKNSMESKNIINTLYETNHHLNQLLNGIGEYPPFQKAVDEYNNKHLDEYRNICKIKRTVPINIKNVNYNDVKDSYMPVPSKRATWQAIKIVKEIVDIVGKPPKKIFIETTRENDKTKKGKVIKSRYKQLEEKLASIKKTANDINTANDMNIDVDNLKKELENNQNYISSNRLYLYFSQCGKSLYTGEPIDINKLKIKYQEDHIFPRSVTNDDSLVDNLVLVEEKLNRDKSANTLRSVMPKDQAKLREILKLWKFLYEKEFISKEKYKRLKYSLKNDYLSDDVLEEFKNRQLVSTSQSTKAVKDLLTGIFSQCDANGKKLTEIVFSKARLVSEFRDNFGMYKSRDINDAHHAKDAYLNIVVGNVYNTEFTHDYWKHFEKSSNNESHNITAEKIYGRNIGSGDNIAWEEGKSINVVKGTMHKDNVLLTRMQITGKGALFKETIHPLLSQEAKKEVDKGKTNKKKKNAEDIPLKEGVIPIKNNDIHYGFYKDISTAFFTLIFDSRKQKIKVECIPIWYLNKHKDLTDYNIVKSYCTLSNKEGGLGYKDIEVLVPKLRKKSLLYFKDKGGFAGYISGKDQDRVTLNTSNVLNFEKNEPYAVQIFKFLERKKKNEKYSIEEFNRRTDITDNEKKEKREKARPIITKERNQNLYDYLIDIHKDEKFVNRPCSKLERFISGRVIFQSDVISIEKQVELLAEIINYFNGHTADLRILGGDKDSGRLRIGRSITKRVYIINQSVTGLFENSTTFKVDND